MKLRGEASNHIVMTAFSVPSFTPLSGFGAATIAQRSFAHRNRLHEQRGARPTQGRTPRCGVYAGLSSGDVDTPDVRETSAGPARTRRTTRADRRQRATGTSRTCGTTRTVRDHTGGAATISGTHRPVWNGNVGSAAGTSRDVADGPTGRAVSVHARRRRSGLSTGDGRSGDRSGRGTCEQERRQLHHLRVHKWGLPPPRRR